MKELTNTEATWIAAVMETDGSIRLNKTKTYCQPALRAVQRIDRREILDRLQELLGGSVKIQARAGYDKNTMDTLIWSLYGKERIANVIQQILSFMVTQQKKNQAKKVLEYCLKPSGLIKLHTTKEELKELYWNKGLKQSEIAEHFNVHGSTIQRRMQEFNIPTR